MMPWDKAPEPYWARLALREFPIDGSYVVRTERQLVLADAYNDGDAEREAIELELGPAVAEYACGSMAFRIDADPRRIARFAAMSRRREMKKYRQWWEYV